MRLIAMRTCYYTGIPMACPLFLPAAPLPGFAPESTPLGELYDGRCSADPGGVIPPETLRRCCNRGYARGVCARAAATHPDAFRFLVKADDGDTVTLAWSSERDHLPLAAGSLVVTARSAASGEPLELQARACAAAYRRLAGKERIAI
jgi:hypothetical protein